LQRRRRLVFLWDRCWARRLPQAQLFASLGAPVRVSSSASAHLGTARDPDRHTVRPQRASAEKFCHEGAWRAPHTIRIEFKLWALLLLIADRDGLRKPKPVNAARKFSTRCTLCF